jgi:putative ABC transport system permease protein
MTNGILQDLRYNARILRNKSAYSLVAIVMLALGIGSATAVFSVVNAVLLKPFGPVDTDQWVYLWEQRLHSEKQAQLSVSIPNFRDWNQGSAAVFSDMVLWLPWSYTASGSGVTNPERIRAAVVSPEIFRATAVTPAAGRLLTAEDSNSGDRRVVLSYEFWRRAFGEDRSLPGKRVTLNGAPHTVVGIAPPGFAFPPEDRVDVWTVLPASAMSASDRSQRGYRAAAKLRHGVTTQAAQSAMSVIAARLAGTYPEDKEYGVLVIPMREAVAGDFRRPLVALSGALGFALLLLCINIGYLRRVNLEGRRKEITLRGALGASRARLIRQLFIETLMLFVIGGGLGVLVAPIGIRVLVSFIPARETPWLKVAVDVRVLLVSIAVTSLAAVLSGLFPIIRGSKTDLARSLGSDGAVTGTAGIGGRMRGLIVVPQIAFALIPLWGAGLLVRSFANLLKVAPGFQSEQRLTLSVSAPRSRYPGSADVSALAERIRDEVASVPGMARVGLAQSIPFAPGARWMQAVSRADPKGIRNFSELPLVRYTVVTPGYFEAMGIPLKSGRLVTRADSHGAQPAVVINEKFVHQQFPAEDPIGKQIWIGHAELLPSSSPKTIVGVVGDTHMFGLDQDADASAWVPIAQQDASTDVWRDLFLVGQTGPALVSPLKAIRERIIAIDHDLAIADVSYMDERVRESLWRQRFTSMVVAAFGLAALGVAILGIFGVTSYLITLRSHELGVRMALGATSSDILSMVLRQSAVLVAIGTLVGLAGAFGLTRALQGLLFGVEPTDPLTFALVAGVLVATAMAASLGPARKAASTDPIKTLRFG